MLDENNALKIRTLKKQNRHQALTDNRQHL